jgi:hypothetical protein
LHGGPGDPAVTRCGDEEETRLCGVSLYLYRQQIDCTTRAPVGPVVVASTGTSAGTDLFRVRDEEQVYRLSTKTFSAGACYDLLVYDGALPATAVVSIPVRAAIVRDEDDGDWGESDEGR